MDIKKKLITQIQDIFQHFVFVEKIEKLILFLNTFQN